MTIEVCYRFVDYINNNILSTSSAIITCRKLSNIVLFIESTSQISVKKLRKYVSN